MIASAYLNRLKASLPFFQEVFIPVQRTRKEGRSFRRPDVPVLVDLLKGKLLGQV